MSLLDLVIPSRKVVINQAVSDKPEVSYQVFGLTTEDFIYLVQEHSKVLAAVFLQNAKEDLKESDSSKAVLMAFPSFGAACIACGCKEREAAPHVESLPLMTQIELLSAVFSLTFPDGVKK